MPTTKPLPPATVVTPYGLFPGFIPLGGPVDLSWPGDYLFLLAATSGHEPLPAANTAGWDWGTYPGATATLLYPGAATFPGRGAIQLYGASTGFASLVPDTPGSAVLNPVTPTPSTVTPDSHGSLTLTPSSTASLTLSPASSASAGLSAAGATSKPLVPNQRVTGTFPGIPTYPGATTWPGNVPVIHVIPDPVVP